MEGRVSVSVDVCPECAVEEDVLDEAAVEQLLRGHLLPEHEHLVCFRDAHCDCRSISRWLRALSSVMWAYFVGRT